MPFQPLNQVLHSLKGQYHRQEQQRWQQVSRHWAEVVGPVVAAQTRPLSMQRDVLKVATSSAAWAQNLVFERQRILDKLNGVLSFQLSDIRFSPAQWHSTQPATFPGAQQQTELWQAHPSRRADVPPLALQPEPPIDAEAAFQNWATTVRSRSSQLPLCPECQCPTPTGELERWQVCALCAAKCW